MRDRSFALYCCEIDIKKETTILVDSIKMSWAGFFALASIQIVYLFISLADGLEMIYKKKVCIPL
jgi:hypothetical protein